MSIAGTGCIPGSLTMPSGPQQEPSTNACMHMLVTVKATSTLHALQCAMFKSFWRRHSPGTVKHLFHVCRPGSLVNSHAGKGPSPTVGLPHKLHKGIIRSAKQ